MNLELRELNARIKSIKINNLNPNDDVNSVETNLTCHISIEVALSNQSLAMFDSQLIKAFYQKKPRKDSNPQELLEIENNFMPHLKFPAIKKIPWKAECTDYTFKMLDDRPISGDTVVMHGCEINRIYIEPQEGGTVALSMDIHGTCQKEQYIANLFHYIQRDAEISVLPPDDSDDNQMAIEA